MLSGLPRAGKIQRTVCSASSRSACLYFMAKVHEHGFVSSTTSSRRRKVRDFCKTVKHYSKTSISSIRAQTVLHYAWLNSCCIVKRSRTSRSHKFYVQVVPERIRGLRVPRDCGFEHAERGLRHAFPYYRVVSQRMDFARTTSTERCTLRRHAVDYDRHIELKGTRAVA